MCGSIKKRVITVTVCISLICSSYCFSQINKQSIADVSQKLEWINTVALKNYVEDIKGSYKGDISSLMSKISFIENELPGVRRAIMSADVSLETISKAKDIVSLHREILMSNPLLDNAEILVARYTLGDKSRKAMAPSLGTAPNNWSSLLSSSRSGYNAQIARLSSLRDTVTLSTIYKPSTSVPISDMQLHWDSEKILFSSVDENKKWQVYEIDSEGTNLHRKIVVDEPDLEFCDANYLPDGNVVATTNIGYNGVPCVHGDDMVANLILYNPQNKKLRRLTFDQDGNWNPIVKPDGRIMYTRWEYTDLTHYFSRIVMHMNPDGTANKAVYGSGSYFPNSTFDVKPISQHDSRFVGIISGHHGVARSGRLMIFDPIKGRKEEKGMVQEIPFSNRKIEPIIKDELVDGVWPQFIKPYPLNDKYFLVAAKLSSNSLWGIYLVDIYDNLTLIVEKEGEGFISPVLFKKSVTPPIIHSSVKEEQDSATVFIQDIYEGEGTAGVPRGVIKSLRIFAYEYAYVRSPSDHDAQGIQSGWDIKRILGEVSVETDGSVMFKVPANTPISIQPLDKEGAAVQWMRSWLTAMPGEVVSCIGCHEDQNSIPIPKKSIASQKQVQHLNKPRGGVRPFTFDLEVQPVLDKYCISCHDGQDEKPNFKSGDINIYKRGVATKIVRPYQQSYLNLHPYVYRQGPEADIYVLKPYEYHSSNSSLIRILKSGHHGVVLSSQAWKTLYTWIDLNAPYFGSFTQLKEFNGYDQVKRRQELSLKYSNVMVDWQNEIEQYAQYLKDNGIEDKPKQENNFVFYKKDVTPKIVIKEDYTDVKRRTINITDSVSIDMVWVPAGVFTMGDNTSQVSSPFFEARVEKGFWMSTTEVTNKQYAKIVPSHDSRYVGQTWKDHTTPGYAVNKADQPVVRVSCNDAVTFCEELSERNGLNICLPTEIEWEWAARGGSASDMWYGGVDDDFSSYENLADTTLSQMAVVGVNPRPMSAKDPMRAYWDFYPKVGKYNDNALVSTSVASYKPNMWGLYDMCGNVAEWTISDYKDYPLKKKNDRNDDSYKVVRGGSWRDRPSDATVTVRKRYYSWQSPFDVGFRIIIREK